MSSRSDDKEALLPRLDPVGINKEPTTNYGAAGDSSRGANNTRRNPPKGCCSSSKYPDPAICGWCCFDVYPMCMLLCIMFLTFGSYWVFDTPGAIFTQLHRWFGPTYTSSRNLNLYSIYSWPNTVLAFFGGYIVDRITGVRAGAILFCFLILMGETMFCIGVTWQYYWVCFFGRFVFGLGGESLTVAQNTFTVRWFDGRYLALAFGLVVAFARVGSSVNFVVTPHLAESVPLAVWFGAAMCATSFGFGVMGAFLDWYGEARVKKKPSGETISLRHISRFPLPAWFIFFICMFFYIGVLTFYTVASDILQHTGAKYAPTEATFFLSIPNFVSIIASPTFGYLVDRKGKALIWIIIASLMEIVAHAAFFVTANEWYEINPVPVMLWLGFAYSLGAASLWPIVSLIVPDSMQGTAYGTMTSVQNAGLAVFPMAIGYLQDYLTGHLRYTIPLLIFVGTAIISFIMTVFLIGLDKKYTHGILNMSADERIARENKMATMSEAGEDPYEDMFEPVVEVVEPTYRPNTRNMYLARLGIHRPAFAY